MARGVNKVILIGNLGGDPEVRYTPGGSPVATVSLATTSSWRDKQSGELQERTEWHRIVFFNRLAEIVGEYLRKGAKAYIEGSLRTRKWQDRNGNERFTTEIVANEMQMLDRSGGAQGGGNEHHNSQPAHHHDEPAGSMAGDQGAASAGATHQEQFDDDIPF